MTSQKDNEVTVSIYNTSYVLVRQDDTWINHSSNYFTMAPHLINAVIDAIAGGIKA